MEQSWRVRQLLYLRRHLLRQHRRHSAQMHLGLGCSQNGGDSRHATMGGDHGYGCGVEAQNGHARGHRGHRKNRGIPMNGGGHFPMAHSDYDAHWVFGGHVVGSEPSVQNHHNVDATHASSAHPSDELHRVGHRCGDGGSARHGANERPPSDAPLSFHEEQPCVHVGQSAWLCGCGDYGFLGHV